MISRSGNRQWNGHFPHSVAYRLLPIISGIVLKDIDNRTGAIVDGNSKAQTAPRNKV